MRANSDTFPPSRAGVKKGAFQFTLPIAIAVALSLALMGVSVAAQPIVSIYEIDNLPTQWGTTNFWDWSVKNNSTSDHVSGVYLYRVYSSREPTPENLPGMWEMTSSHNGDDTLWQVQLIANKWFDYLGPGDENNFTVGTYIPTNSTVILGTNYGQAWFVNANDKLPALPGDDFIGPIGAVTNQPEPAVLVPEGGATNLVFGVTGVPFSLQWYFNGTNALAGATNATLARTFSLADQGSYQCVAYSPYGSATSAVAVVTVSPAPAAVMTGIEAQTNGVRVSFTGSPWLRYGLERAPTALGTWQSFTNAAPGPDGRGSVLDGNPFPAAGFYRTGPTNP